MLVCPRCDQPESLVEALPELVHLALADLGHPELARPLLRQLVKAAERRFGDVGLLEALSPLSVPDVPSDLEGECDFGPEEITRSDSKKP